MEFGLREWLIVGGVILVVLILLDGFRRMRNERRNSIKMSLGSSLGVSASFPDDDYGNELPSGGARVVSRTEPSLGHGREDIGLEDTSNDLDNLRDASVSYTGAASDYSKGQSQQASQRQNEQMFIIYHVKAKNEEKFSGSDLLQILLACDMRYGERSILHRHEKANGQGDLQFSVANMLEPGIFNLDDIDSFETPGVTFFMTIPGAKDPVFAYDCMIETAQCLVKNLDAVLLDEDHSVASLQLINHHRERIMETMRKMPEQQPELEL